MKIERMNKSQANTHSDAQRREWVVEERRYLVVRTTWGCMMATMLHAAATKELLCFFVHFCCLTFHLIHKLTHLLKLQQPATHTRDQLTSCIHSTCTVLLAIIHTTRSPVNHSFHACCNGYYRVGRRWEEEGATCRLCILQNDGWVKNAQDNTSSYIYYCCKHTKVKLWQEARTM